MHPIFNIRDFGAVGDGKTGDTRAVQDAIDACNLAGGGVTYCPPGAYRIGSIELKSRVELRVEGGAILRGSHDRADYIKRLPARAIIKGCHSANCDECLIWARDAEHIAITGRGVIDGQGSAFFSPNPRGPKYGLTVKEWRPGFLVMLEKCRDVLLRDIRLVDSPFYTVMPLGCERVLITGISIANNRIGPNTDGIDLHCCRDVRISDCSISTGDDCITCYSMPFWLENAGPCENITVTNCTLTTRCCGVRIGYGPSDLPVRNCVFSNLVMHNIATGIDFLCPLVSETPAEFDKPASHGPPIENISFDNIVVEGDRALHMWVEHKARLPAGIRNINVSNLTGTIRQAVHLEGTPDFPIENIRLRNWRLKFQGAADERLACAVPWPNSCWASVTRIPWGFFARYLRNLSLRDIEVAWGETSGLWQGAFWAESVEGLEVDGLRGASAPPSEAPFIRLVNVKAASLRNCRMDRGRLFLRVEGAGSERIAALANDLRFAAASFDVSGDVPRGVLRETGNLAAPH